MCVVSCGYYPRASCSQFDVAARDEGNSLVLGSVAKATFYEIEPTIDASDDRSLSQAAHAAEFSRVIGGIHTPSAVAHGLELGNFVGDIVYAYMQGEARTERQIRIRKSRGSAEE